MDSLVADGRIVLARERPFRLGEVEVRPATREVIGPAGRETLEPRVMQVLVALARAGGDVVTRDDLTASCWDGRVVGEDAISRVISRLRRLSDGVGRDGWTLETVTKVGYRLLPADLHPDAAPTAAPPRKPKGRRALLAGGLAAAAVAAGGGWLWRTRRQELSPEARAVLTRARESLRDGTTDQIAAALGLAREAVQLAPRHAPAWGTLALAYGASLSYTPPGSQPAVRAQVRAAAERGLELDPGDAESNIALAIMEPVYRNWAVADQRLRRALARYPHNAELQGMFGVLLLNLGRAREAVPVLQGAVADDAFAPWSRYSLGHALWTAGRMEEAADAIAKARARWPRHYALWFLQFDFLAFSGRPDQALAFGEDRTGWPGGVPGADIALRLEDARALLSRAPAALAAAAERHLTHARQGLGYAENAMIWMSAVGRLDDAFALARGIYVGEGLTLGPYRFSADNGRFTQADERNTHPLFGPPTSAMRGDPRFAVLVRDIGLAAYWQASGRPPDDPRVRRAIGA